MERRKKNNIDYQGFPSVVAVAVAIASSTSWLDVVPAAAAATIYMPQLQPRLVHCLKRRSN